MTTSKHTPPIVFVSATSGDLGSVRRLVKNALLKIGCMPIEQDDFPPDYRDVADFLKAEIKKCDAIIHIAGLRYGAEPNPDSLPTGKMRRSYTQLEYDIARELKKPCYSFICSDDFPFDECEPEGEMHRQLQLAHRQVLISAGPKYENVGSPMELDRKILALRLQIERLVNSINRLEKRHIISAMIVMVALFLLGMVSAAIWLNTFTTGQKVTQLESDSDRLLEQADKIQSQGNEIQESAETVVKMAVDSKAQLQSLDKTITTIVTTDLVDQIAKDAGVDSLEIKQLVSQAKSSDTTVLNFAEQLIGQNRVNEGVSLARFVAETAIQENSSDFLAASVAFRIAAHALENQAKLELDRAKFRKLSEQAEVLAKRARDALRGASDFASSSNIVELVEITLLHARSLVAIHYASQPKEVHRLIDVAIAELEEVLRIGKIPEHSHGRILAQLGVCRRERADWITFSQFQKELEMADELGKKSVELLSANSNSLPELLVAHLELARTLEKKAGLLFPAQASTLYQAAAEHLDAASTISNQAQSNTSVANEIWIERGRLAIDSARNAIDEKKLNSGRANAYEHFSKALREAQQNGDRHIAGQANFGIFQVHVFSGELNKASAYIDSNNWPARQLYNNLSEYGRFVNVSTNRFHKGFYTDAEETLKLARQARSDAKHVEGSYRYSELLVHEAEREMWFAIASGKLISPFTLRADQDLSLISQDDLFGVFKNQSNFGGGLKESDADRTRRRDSEDASRRALEIVDSLFSSHDFHRMPNSLWLRAKKVQLWAHEKIFGEDESVIANRKEVLDRLANDNPLESASMLEDAAISWELLARRNWHDRDRELLDSAVKDLEKAKNYLLPSTSPTIYASICQKLSRTLETLAVVEQDASMKVDHLKKAVHQLALADCAIQEESGNDYYANQASELLERIGSRQSVELQNEIGKSALRFTIPLITSSLERATDSKVKGLQLRRRAQAYFLLASSSPEAVESEKLEVTDDKLYKSAKSDLDEAIRLNPDDMEAVVLRAKVSRKTNDLPAARRDINTVLDSSQVRDVSNSARELRRNAISVSASVGLAERNYEVAIRDLKLLVNEFKNDANKQAKVLHDLAMAYYDNNQNDESLKSWEQAAKLLPSNWRFHLLRADLLAQMGKDSEAVKAYEQALKWLQEKDNAGAYVQILNGLAWILATSMDDKVRNGKRALGLAIRACELRSFSDASLLSTLAAAHAEVGDFSKAVEVMEKAIAIGDPGDKTLVNLLRAQLKSYQDGKPTRWPDASKVAP